MDLAERLISLTIGGVIGFVVGYIVAKLDNIKKELDNVEHILEDRPRDEQGDSRAPDLRKNWRNILLFVVVIIVGWGAIQTQLNNNELKRQQALIVKQQERDRERVAEDQIARCVGAVESRAAQRDIVEAVFNLATATLPSGRDLPASEVEIQRYNRFIDQANQFRTDTYKKIKPSKPCEPYVQDDNVTPPPPPFPRFPARTND